jgi:hypothetical protein
MTKKDFSVGDSLEMTKKDFSVVPPASDPGGGTPSK